MQLQDDPSLEAARKGVFEHHLRNKMTPEDMDYEATQKVLNPMKTHQ